ncbi:MAG: glycoside hydrolase family 3 N-terminal domain-containing protein [Gemmiger sp.]|uniref:glycoside hydrolase family 3 N-terminal domain-containing protein n=1 Tax=Gemmiger sp. TaxID=2049027 RepID=UPI002E76AC1E|nr:glycoside hydrolase family 3 N-terminal domain-containing protein [Gemmiger sp.]MEE0801057.1 glycoside hydrolase family 3 N-terminal domain-containing protein [Gemmiger sp.]
MPKASDHIKVYRNEGGAVISTVNRRVIERDGLVFKDIDGSGEVSAVNDWRLPAAERAAAYAAKLTVHEKLAQLFVADWRMGKYPAAGPNAPKIDKPVYDETGILDETECDVPSIFGLQHVISTTQMLKESFYRHVILRANATPTDLADWINQVNAVCEECEHYLPMSATSNSRNENGEVVFGMNDAFGVLATWPGTLGIAAAVKGTGRIDIIDKFADTVRREWNACGMRKGYMYMADTVSDPRWQRTYGTFGEDPALISEIMRHLVPGIQGSPDGVTKDGVAVTTKHFPGGGARENGFDPHYAAGQWNVYATEGSLEKYHMPPFRAAVECNTSSIMPYYSKPAAAKSAPQTDIEGNVIDFEPYGFAYNKYFIDTILRGQLGFRGYINSDSGISRNMAWGVEMLDIPERIGFAVNHSGVDIISGIFDSDAALEAYNRATNGYYDTHPVPEGFTADELVLTDEALTRAVTRTMTEMFEVGMVDDPFRDPAEAEKVVANKADWDEAARVHRESVVLLKNDGTLPLTAEKTAGRRLYAEAFHKDPRLSEQSTAKLRELLKDFDLTDDPAQADYAILFVTPQSGAYFNATPGYLELDLCEGKTVHNVNEDGKPVAETHEETTVTGMGRIAEIAKAVHARGGKVISNLNITLAWEVGNLESVSDAMTAGFDTYPDATVDVMLGRFAPVGKLPLTLPRGDAVLAVNADGVCISPNDVPGFDKDQYLPDSLKDENGKAYAYRDAAGNYYEYGFGLHY